jgi:DNA-binding response OmpR family regulator
MPRIIVVDDDQSLTQAIQVALEPIAEVRCAHSVAEAKATLTEFTPNVMIIDYRLGSESGYSLIQESLLSYPPPKTILITAFAEKDMAIEAIHLRVHTLIEKPFSLERLRADVKSALFGGSLSSTFRVDDLARQVTNKGKTTQLTAIEMKIFTRMLSQIGQVVAREDLNQLIWGENRVSSHALDTHLSNLKKKSADMGMSIRVIWGHGYIMEKIS